MSIRNDPMKPLHDILSLFYPPVCPACGRAMGEGARYVCTGCRMDIPLTGFASQFDNPVSRRFWGLLPVVNASSFIYYIPDSNFARLIHRFKYRGGWREARDMGLWFGTELHQGCLYSDVDVVIPVPLHLRKRLARGYNQSEYIAEGIARAMGLPVDRRSVIRHKHNESQARKQEMERWENAEGIFTVRNPEALRGKHILLVDDVLTTGATIISMGETVLKAMPDCRISIATLAVSKARLKTY